MKNLDAETKLKNCDSQLRQLDQPSALWRLLLCLILPLVSFGLSAQEEPENLLADLPETRQLAAALSEPDFRTDTLMTMITVARMLDSGYTTGPAQTQKLEDRFRDERAWLDRLAERYAEMPMRGSLLDPSAWNLLVKLDQKQLVPDSSSSPLGPETRSLLHSLFDRSDERLAAALLPEVLPRIELVSTKMWEEVLFTASVNHSMLELVRSLNADWFDPWVAAEPPAPEGGEESPPIIAQSVESLRAIAADMIVTGPPDALRLKRLRFSLLSALPILGVEQSKDAEYLLILASALDGLPERNYLSFTESLLWIATSLVLDADPPKPGLDQSEETVPEQPSGDPIPPLTTGDTSTALGETFSAPEEEPLAGPEADTVAEQPPYVSPIAPLLSEVLPALSNAYAGEFSEVDPRINSSLAAVFDVVQYLRNPSSEENKLPALRAEIADAVAQLVLLIPDMNYYFDQPVRQQISDEMDICIRVVADSMEQGEAVFGRQQFDSCLESLNDLASNLLNRSELAGDSDGPFGAEQLRRELVMTPWQRINFAMGYLHDNYPADCELPDNPLPNPLEWSNLVTTISWFARQSPVYFQTPENEALIFGMRQQGTEMLETLLRQLECISTAGPGTNDPVIKNLVVYRESLDALVAGLREAELVFRSSQLKPGADVVLYGDASQSTAYRPDELEIGPCEESRICEMSGQLEATRAMIGQFPDVYLIADQTGLGTLEICYDNMQWINRRAEPVRAEDPHVANYYGQLSFDLLGRYREGGEVADVFGANFVSPSEYHYLFAAATEEVLQDPCPTEWVGSRIVTGLGSGNKIRVVPNRLTYLAAARSRPSVLVNTNWDKNEEWRDSFITGLDVNPFNFEPDATLNDRVSQHLQSLYQAEQSVLYNALLNPPARGRRNESVALYGLLDDLSSRKALVRTFTSLFYPQTLIDSDEIRASLIGNSSLLDRVLLRRFRASNVAVSAIHETGIARLERLQAEWSRQPEVVRRTGSMATSVAHALVRLDVLYSDFFVLPDPRDDDQGELRFSGAPSR
jgi:hypothetical protein